MTHEKILARPDGSKVKIAVSIFISYGKLIWRTDVSVRPAKKRTWYGVWNANDYKWRRLATPEEKAQYVHAKKLEVCTDEELLQATTELWEKIKPTQ